MYPWEKNSDQAVSNVSLEKTNDTFFNVSLEKTNDTISNVSLEKTTDTIYMYPWKTLMIALRMYGTESDSFP